MEPWIELSEPQRRQFLDAEMAFEAWERARDERRQHRGSMFWREQGGRRYLIRMSATSNQRSLGAHSPETEAMFERFTARKLEVENRLRHLEQKLEQHRRVNKALRVGRAPNILVAILDSLGRLGVLDHFLVVGTNALYAYEMAAGVRLPTDAMATMDADLLFDTRKRSEFIGVMKGHGDKTFLDLLKKADRSFERVETDISKAVNDSGYEVELLRRMAPAGTDESQRLTADDADLWPVQASTGEKLLSARRFSQVIVAANGEMARMQTVHPLAFATIKADLARKRGRDRLKAPKDAMQAEMVAALVEQLLPHLKDAPDTPETAAPASRSSRS
jgi:hypothetical protein